MFIAGSCRKDKSIEDPSAVLDFSQDSLLFDTVFTTKGSSTRELRVINNHNQKISISSIRLRGGEASVFFMNVDGSPGRTFSDIEIAANDSMFIFVQVNVNPTNSGSPLIINDAIDFTVNGNEQTVILEAWGQDAYYHHATNALKFPDGTYMPYSIVDTYKESYTILAGEYVWKTDKPHVIYGYLVVDSLQKLRIPAGTRVYLNYRAGIWVYRYGQLRVTGLKDREVIFDGARRERDFADDPGQWDRIWINEGSDNNLIDYAIIRNGYIGVQAELFKSDTNLVPGKLTIRNTKIENMSKWGLYGVAFNILGGNNVISNCQEHSLNLMYGGRYEFYHCTFANFWKGPPAREKAAINLNNYTDRQIIPHFYYFGNCIIDGYHENEINIDLKASPQVTVSYIFSNSWLKTTNALTDANHYVDCRKGTSIKYKDIDKFNFEPASSETQLRFSGPQAASDVLDWLNDINKIPRKLNAPEGITAGAYELP